MNFQAEDNSETYQDRSQTSVSSLLALLRSTQDEVDAEASTKAPAASASQHTSGSASARAAATSGAAPSVPSSRQLSDLLAQLNDSGSTTPTAPGSGVSPERRGSSGFKGASHGLIDFFGPVGEAPRASGAWDPAGVRRASDDKHAPSASSRDATATGGSPSASTAPKASPIKVALAAAADAAPASSTSKGKRKAEHADPEEMADWSFTRCLPVITDLLEDEEFVKELQRMKAEQDTLERRLWARMEKVKAEHGRKNATEREVAKITRKPIPPDRQAEWNRQLKVTLVEFFKKHVQPSVDSLAARQRMRLMELGVPGLGSGEAPPSAGEKQRVGRVMDVLDGAVADAAKATANPAEW